MNSFITCLDIILIGDHKSHTHTQVSPIPGHGMGMKLEPDKLNIRLLPLGLAMMDNMVIVMVVIVQV